MTEREFENLVLDLKQGNEKLFEKLYIEHYQYCLDWVHRKYKDLAKSEDVTMDAFIKFRGLLIQDKIKFGNIRGYLVKICNSEYLKKIDKKTTYELPFALPDELSDNEHYENQMIALEKAWKEIGDKCQTLLKSYFYNAISLKNSWESLGYSSYDSIKKQKERCQKKLKEIMQISLSAL